MIPLRLTTRRRLRVREACGSSLMVGRADEGARLAEEAVMAETATTEETPVRLEGDQWVFLIDPSWQAEAAEKGEGGADPEKPPLEAGLGGWFFAESGVPSRFHANPAYEPTTPDSPTDPVDAVLRLVV